MQVEVAETSNVDCCGETETWRMGKRVDGLAGVVFADRVATFGAGTHGRTFLRLI
jgi:hypothetical protein